MKAAVIRVGVVIERRLSGNPWVDHSWNIAGLLPDAPDLEADAVLRHEGDVLTFYAGSADVEFHAVETANYRDNLQSGQPLLWVMLQTTDGEPGLRLVSVTADPAEGEAMTGTGDLVIEAVPMPPAIAARLSEFVEAHHVERDFVKRVRDR